MTDANPALAEVVESVGIRLRCLGQPALALAAALAYGVVVHLHDPTQPWNYPTCPFLWLTGWACPGCGTLRASHELTEGNVVGALAYNPLTVLTVVGLGVVWVRWVRRLWLGRARTLAPPWMARGLVVLIIAFWILRNLPGFEFLGPPRG